MASKGVRCGSHPKYAAAAREMEDWLLDKIDSSKQGMTLHGDTRHVRACRGDSKQGARHSKIARDNARLSLAKLSNAAHDKEKGGH